LAALVALLATPLLARVATAQGGPVDENGEALTPERIEARRILAEGNAHCDSESWAQCAMSFTQLYEYMRAHAFERAPRALYNAGLALSRLPGRERQARDTLQRFLDESVTLLDVEGIAEDRSHAVQVIGDLDARIHLAEGGAPDHTAGDTPRSGPSDVVPAPEAGPLSPIGPVVLGFGAAMLLAGGIVGAVVLVQDDDLDAMCPDSRCPESARGLADDIAGLALASDVLSIGGGVVAVVGLILTLTLREDAPAATAGCGPDGCGVQLRGRF
jgi:hypothetical protein